MTNKLETHHVSLKLDRPLAENIPVASDIGLKVQAACSFGCDLSGATVHLVAGEEIAAASRLVASPGETAWSETEEFSVQAPETLGSFTWLVLFKGGEIGGVPHEQTSLPISFATAPIAVSLAVWDVPATAVIGEPFRIKVGVKSSRACALKGADVEVLDDNGRRMGVGRIGESPWAGTTALYWADIEVTAPDKDGSACWSARFPPTVSGLPHGQGLAQFTFIAVKPPDHKLTIMVVDKETAAPIDNARLRVGCFRIATDPSGLAELNIPDSHYEITAWMTSHELPPTTIEVTEDMMLRLEATGLPEEDPYARWR
jgi:hypothetical protein